LKSAIATSPDIPKIDFKIVDVLVIFDSKTETSKEILLKVFPEEDFFRFPLNTSLDGGDERAILERREQDSGKR
jgi:hypothetical protein